VSFQYLGGFLFAHASSQFQFLFFLFLLYQCLLLFGKLLQSQFFVSSSFFFNK
jgi:hypothetical protein